MASNDKYLTLGHVGIGTTAPTSILHLRGATPIMTFQPTGTTQQSYIQFKTSAGGAGFEFGRDRFSAGRNDFYFYDDNAGAERMYISNTGNVGIGTSSPGAPLEVNGMVASKLNGYKFPDGSSDLHRH